LVIAGTRNLLVGNDPRDGLLVALEGPTAASSLLGGSGNDQLYAIASSQDRFCAGGFTRSFRGTAQGNQAFLVLGTGSSTTQVVRQYSPSDAALEVRAIIPNGTGWMWAGYHDTSWVFVTMGSTGMATAAQTVSYPSAFTGRQLRALARQGSLLALVGDLDEGTATRGVVVVLEATSPTAYTLRWAQRASGTDYTSFLDVTFDGADLLVAGIDGESGVLLRMNPTTGARVAEARVPGWQLRTIRSATPPISVGSTDGGLIVGRWTTGAFTGFDLRGLEPVSLRSAVPLFATDGGFRLVAKSGTALADVQVNDALQPSCDGGASGRSQRLTIPSVAGLTFTTLTATVNTVSLLSETLTGTGLGSLQVSAGPLCLP
jgi:hypothetical protein